MKSLPIIMTAPSVMALLDGRKSMTRRLAFKNGKPTNWQKLHYYIHGGGEARLWVKEAWAIDGCRRRVSASQTLKERLQYVATDDAPSTESDGAPYWWNSRSAIFMPR